MAKTCFECDLRCTAVRQITFNLQSKLYFMAYGHIRRLLFFSSNLSSLLLPSSPLPSRSPFPFMTSVSELEIVLRTTDARM